LLTDFKFDQELASERAALAGAARPATQER